MISESFKERLSACLKSPAHSLRQGGATLLLILTVYAASVETLLQPLGWEIEILNPVVRPLSQLLGFNRSGFNRSGFNSPKLASFLIHKVYIKCLGACPEDLYSELGDVYAWKN